jgi:hypothetical protein
MNERGGPEASDSGVGKRRLPAGLLAPCVVLAGSGWDFLLRVTGRALFICLIDQLKKMYADVLKIVLSLRSLSFIRVGMCMVVLSQE